MKYIIRWDAGYGASYETIEVETEEEADKWAYQNWSEEVESNADYGVECEWTEEAAEDFGVD